MPDCVQVVLEWLVWLRLEIVYAWRGGCEKARRGWIWFRECLAWQPQTTNLCLICLDVTAVPGLEEAGKEGVHVLLR